ncbi:MAG: glycoside hydrolase family 31 protein, partial [Candidatus Competibacteraceae bacterium]|nr:glycoside hydrolase family 31 protein [Candidatus Competibacteraceae bacterium]
MRFGQKLHPLNFDYGSDLSIAAAALHLTGRHCDMTVQAAVVFEGCLRLGLDNAYVTDKRQYSLGVVEELRSPSPLAPSGEGIFAGGGIQAAFVAGGIKLSTDSGLVLETLAEGIGCNGKQLVLNFDVTDFSGFYGFGERTGKLNKSGSAFQFWNVDVVADHPQAYGRDDYDPTYVSIPLAILKGPRGYLGLFFDNPGMSVIDVEGVECGRLMYQSLAGNTDLYVIDGPRLKDVVRRFTRLTGRHEVPPLWAMGYHQCRWGYQTEAEFLELRDSFAHFHVPVSALWHDIDYMDGYRLFTWDLEDFPSPARLGEVLKGSDIHSVTIVDPGVKLDPGYAVYDDGMANDVFCKTESGRDYVGRVWPGDTVFPDFSLPAVREWWAEHLAAFVQESRIDGLWLDMNEPATGYSAEELMRFEGGRVPHDRYHNQYGLLMAMASRQALDNLDPDRRPFILTRAAWAGIQRYSALWTGDNVSSWKHLRMAI